jgi:hypothetical protein
VGRRAFSVERFTGKVRFRSRDRTASRPSVRSHSEEALQACCRGSFGARNQAKIVSLFPGEYFGVISLVATITKSIRDWGERWGSNPRPLESQSRALPTELRPPQAFGQWSDLRRPGPHSARYSIHKTYRCRRTIPLRSRSLPDPWQRAFSNGAPGRIRTCDPRLRRPLLYPTELRAPRLDETIWSGQRDSNPRPPAPKAGALPACAMPRRSSSRAFVTAPRRISRRQTA